MAAVMYANETPEQTHLLQKGMIEGYLRAFSSRGDLAERFGGLYPHVRKVSGCNIWVAVRANLYNSHDHQVLVVWQDPDGELHSTTVLHDTRCRLTCTGNGYPRDNGTGVVLEVAYWSRGHDLLIDEKEITLDLPGNLRSQ